MEPIIQAKDASFNYISYTKGTGLTGTLKDFFKRNTKKIPAIENLTFSINPGEVIGLLGPNGAGKTTLIKMLTGILPVSSGKISLLENIDPVKKEVKYLNQIGVMLGQKSQLIWDLPPMDTLLMLREIYKVSPEDFKNRIQYLAGLLSVKKQLLVPVRKLSLGQRTKFELICAIIHYPKILFLDEPTIGIDVSSQENIYKFLKKINTETNMTIVLTSHNTKDIEALAQRVIVISHGKKLFEGTTPSLTSKFASNDILEITTKEPIIPLPNNMTQLSDTKYQINDKNTSLIPVPAKQIISVQQKNSDLDTILINLFRSESDEI
ncbi:ABC transporter ATP-binding protein [Levilactobacillus suantsaii]|uniref:ABC transporter ATP-binding protein n=1 Tax=Levilactobacillus suantsaii TaxID=2292255 RepID=UPI001F272E55|nr:ATP-binding cassette domain-containing protein [Levilactobacillus suantsaii]